MKYEHMNFRGTEIRVNPNKPPEIKKDGKWQKLAWNPKNYLLLSDESFVFEQGRLWRGNIRPTVYEFRMNGDTSQFRNGGIFKVEDCWYEVVNIRARTPNSIRLHANRVIKFNNDGTKEYEVQNVRRTQSGKRSVSEPHVGSNGTKECKRRSERKVPKRIKTHGKNSRNAVSKRTKKSRK